MQKQFVVYKYTFIFSDKEKIEFILILDEKNYELKPATSEPYPEWTQIQYYKCPNCTLDEKQMKYCPVAVNLAPLIQTFSTFISYENVLLIVETPQRTYTKNTTLQKALSSLIGIYMTTSNCPILSKLRPLVRFHLPVATAEETCFRVLGMYLIQQYLLFLQGGTPDWELNNLTNLYSEIKLVNKSFCERISKVIEKDAPANAVVLLNCFAEWIYLLTKKPDIKQIQEFITIPKM